MTTPVVTLTTDSAVTTEAVGEFIGKMLRPGAAISLDGDLGVGKTCLAKGLVSGASGYSPSEVTSPAFSLVHEYRADGRPPVFHIDFYRLDSLSAEDAEMFSEYLADGEGIVIAEWGARHLPSLCDSFLKLHLEVPCLDEPDTRTISASAHGEQPLNESILKALSSYANANP